MGPRAALVVATVALVACHEGGFLDGAACPCAEGYLCCPRLDVCVQPTAFDACPALLLDTIEPNVGPLEGGGTLTVTGLAIPEFVEIRVGGADCRLTERPTPNVVTCAIPPGRLGVRSADVVVTTELGEARRVDAFHYVQPPFIDRTPDALAAWKARASGLVVADFDDDGLPDLFFARNADVEDRPLDEGVVYMNRGRFTFEDVTDEDWNTTIGTMRDVATGDFDGDGRTDVVVSRQGTSTRGPDLYVMSSRGDGTFEPIETGVVAEPGLYFASLTTIDLDADGRLDLLTCVESYPEPEHSVALRAYFNVPGRSVLFAHRPGVVHVDVPPGVTFPDCRAIAIADIDGDGVAEIAVAGRYIALLRREGDVYRDVSVEHALPSDDTRLFVHLEFADFDGDGDFDLSALAHEATGAVVFENVEGRLTLAAPVTDGTSLFDVSGVVSDATLRIGANAEAWLDYDLDGDLDRITPDPVAGEARPTVVGRNVGVGGPSFEALALDAVPYALDPRDVRAADLDGDGDLDLVCDSRLGFRGRYLVLQNTEVENRGADDHAKGWLAAARPITDPDGDATDDDTSDDRGAFGVRLDFDLDGPDDAPDFAPGARRLAIRTLVSGEPELVPVGVPADIEALWVRARFDDGSESRARITRDTPTIELVDCREDCAP